MDPTSSNSRCWVSTTNPRYPWRYQPDDDFIVPEDSDGNHFCVIQDLPDS